MTFIARADMHTRIRKRVDANDSTFLDDTQLQEWCIDAYFEHWDIMLAAMGQEAPLSRAAIQTVAGQDYIDPVPFPLNLPSQWVVNVTFGTDATGAFNDDYVADPYRLVRLEWDGLGRDVWEPLRRGNLTADPRTKTPRPWGSGYGVTYFPSRGVRMTSPGTPSGGNTMPPGGTSKHYFSWRIYLDPVPAAVYTLQLWYVAFPQIVWRTYVASPEIVAMYPDEGANYVAEYAAARAAEKMEQDPTPFRAELARIKEQLEKYLTPMDVGGPQFIADHRQYQREETLDPFWDRRR